MPAPDVSTSHPPRHAAKAAAPWVLVSARFAPDGGQDVANHALARHVASKGNPVHLVGYAVSEDLSRFPNVHFHRVTRPLNSNFLGEPFLARAGAANAKKLAPQHPHVLVNGGNCPWGDVNWLHYVHAAYQPDVRTGPLRTIKERLSRRLYLRTERQSVRAARLVIANSQRTKKDAVRLLGVDPGRVHVVYLGFNTERFKLPTNDQRLGQRRRLGWEGDRPVIVFIGALGDRRKGFDTLYAAWLRLAEGKNWDARLIVIGAGAELPLWQRRAAENPLASGIQFLGFRNDVPDLLAGADLLVSPTRYDSYGLGVHEALCCGVPALVSADAGVAERYPDALSGLLLHNAEDGDELSSRLRHWRDHAADYRAAIHPLAVELRAWTWDKMAEQMMDIIQRDS